MSGASDSIGTWKTFSRDGIELAVLDYGGTSPPMVLLHGLAGHAGEWVDTAMVQTRHARVLAFDSRGHGRSTRLPADVSMAAHVDDVLFLIDQLELSDVVLVGQSFGGQVALSVAAKRPELVAGLVLAEAGPGRGNAESIDEITAYLAGWPVPFETREEAETFFGGPSLRARRWADGLEQRSDGLRPAFEVEVMRRTLTEAAATDYWEEWGSLQVPVLVVAGETGSMPKDELARMRATLGPAELVEVPGAGHDVHLEAVMAWNRALDEFLA